MWEILGWSTLAVVVVGVGWFLVRLLRSEQGRDRSYDGNEDMTSGDASASYDQIGGGGGAGPD